MSQTVTRGLPELDPHKIRFAVLDLAGLAWLHWSAIGRDRRPG